MELVTPNLGTIFWMVIIFWLVVVILRKFAWKPILNAMNDREQSIENALSAAQSARKEMESLKAGNEQLLNEARQEREKVLNEAMKLKEKIVAEAKEKAVSEAEKSIKNARQQILNEKERAIDEMKQQITELSLIIAEKIIRQEMSKDKQQQELANRLIEEIKLN